MLKIQHHVASGGRYELVGEGQSEFVDNSKLWKRRRRLDIVLIGNASCAAAQKCRELSCCSQEVTRGVGWFVVSKNALCQRANLKN